MIKLLHAIKTYCFKINQPLIKNKVT